MKQLVIKDISMSADGWTVIDPDAQFKSLVGALFSTRRQLHFLLSAYFPDVGQFRLSVAKEARGAVRYVWKDSSGPAEIRMEAQVVTWARKRNHLDRIAVMLLNDPTVPRETVKSVQGLAALLNAVSEAPLNASGISNPKDGIVNDDKATSDSC